MIVLDTNVLSELMKPSPSPAVLQWLSQQRRSDLCTTAINEAELAYGLAILPSGRREALRHAAVRLLDEGLGGRVLQFDRASAAAFGAVAAKCRAAGRSVSTMDGQIAAIALAHGIPQIATRDVDGFAACGVGLANPWVG